MRIRWTESAVRDLTNICDYIEKNRGDATARRIAVFIYEGSEILGQFPECGRTGRKPGTRELVLNGLPYLAVYRIHNDSVEIVRILHGAQEWP